MVGPAEEPLLHRCRPARVGDQPAGPDAGRFQFAPAAPAVRVVPDDPGDHGVRPEPGEHVGDVGGPAQPDLPFRLAEQDDGGLLRDPFGLAPDVAVEDHVPDDQHLGAAEAADGGGEISGEVRHVGGVPAAGESS